MGSNVERSAKAEIGPVGEAVITESDGTMVFLTPESVEALRAAIEADREEGIEASDLFDAFRDGFLAGERHAFEEGPTKSVETVTAARAAAADYLDEREAEE